MTYKLWRCSCGQEAFAPEGKRPYTIPWTDGHVCNFVPVQEEGGHEKQLKTGEET